MVKLVVSGPAGRMGKAICRLAEETDNIEVVGGLVREGHADIPGLHLAETLEELLKHGGNAGAAGGTVVIDFTEPAATVARLEEAVKLGIPMVIGTTGFSDGQTEDIHRAAAKIPVILSANMSVGINVLLGAVESLSRTLAGYDIEIVEMHHRNKKDAPSGTALTLGKAAAAGRGVRLGDVSQNGREGLVEIRPVDEIGIHAIRGGDVVGDHTVIFAGTGERIEVSHKATSRDAFASGAIRAAEWLLDKPAGLYSMRDVLGLTSD